MAEVDLPGLFPSTFDPASPKPLKVGIRLDIEKRLPETSRRSIRKALMRWCSQEPYLRAIVAGGPRLDLDGNPAGEVTQGERSHALRRLHAVRYQTSQEPRSDRSPTLAMAPTPGEARPRCPVLSLKPRTAT
jgi:ProP effector